VVPLCFLMYGALLEHYKMLDWCSKCFLHKCLCTSEGKYSTACMNTFLVLETSRHSSHTDEHYISRGCFTMSWLTWQVAPALHAGNIVALNIFDTTSLRTCTQVS
jgi:hypothetical protein